MGRRSRLEKALPWYKWFPADWRGSRKVQRMGLAERGLYRELLDECYEKGSIPADPDEIAELMGMDLAEITPYLPVVLRCFRPDDATGRLCNPKIEDIREEQMERRTAMIRKVPPSAADARNGGTRHTYAHNGADWTGNAPQSSEMTRKVPGVDKRREEEKRSQEELLSKKTSNNGTLLSLSTPPVSPLGHLALETPPEVSPLLDPYDDEWVEPAPSLDMEA